jgi:hypothetical protein
MYTTSSFTAPSSHNLKQKTSYYTSNHSQHDHLPTHKNGTSLANCFRFGAIVIIRVQFGNIPARKYKHVHVLSPECAASHTRRTAKVRHVQIGSDFNKPKLHWRSNYEHMIIRECLLTCRWISFVFLSATWNVRIKICKSIIWSVVSYDCETLYFT